jgi:hypothetical protein
VFAVIARSGRSWRGLRRAGTWHAKAKLTLQDFARNNFESLWRLDFLAMGLDTAADT